MWPHLADFDIKKIKWEETPLDIKCGAPAVMLKASANTNQTIARLEQFLREDDVICAFVSTTVILMAENGSPCAGNGR